MQDKIIIDKEYLRFHDDNGIETNDLFSSRSDLIFFSEMVLYTQFSVYALTGNWGSGKSSFIKMFKNIAERNNRNCLYIDAFESDYETEPFNMVIKEIAKFLYKKDFQEKEKFLKVAKKIAVSTSKAVGKFGLGLLLSKVFDNNQEEMKKLLAGINDSLIDEFSYENNSEDNDYGKFKEATKALLDKTGGVIIIIDELDRCRPDFALETIEKVKHIFSIVGLKFILVYNQDIMNSIIRKVYGIETNTERYLNKFVELKYILPEQKVNATWLQHCCELLKEKGINNHIYGIFSNRINDFDNIMTTYKIPPREMERIICLVPYITEANQESAPMDGGYMAIMCVVFEFYKYIDQRESQLLFEYMETKENKLIQYKDIPLFYELVGKILYIEDKDQIGIILRNYVNWKRCH
jgi:energy-coupling factor transporter ATP-binding protein EcfA2